MRLTSLHLHGYRTFARPTDLTLAQGATGIVGPRGCGKTNLLLGIRWCLDDTEAEHPVDHLFFNGTSEVRPSAIAEITLDFIASDGHPVSITRTRFRRDHESTLSISGPENASLNDLQSAILLVHSAAGLSQLAALGCQNRILLLDEVDADLDGSEFNAFLADLDALIEHNQLLIITHNKRTMNRSDTMFGITMEQYGISKSISMRLT